MQGVVLVHADAPVLVLRGVDDPLPASAAQNLATATSSAAGSSSDSRQAACHVVSRMASVSM